MGTNLQHRLTLYQPQGRQGCDRGSTPVTELSQPVVVMPAGHKHHHRLCGCAFSDAADCRTADGDQRGCRTPPARPDSKAAMANPLGDPGVPYVNRDSPATRIVSVHQLINYLNVTVSYRYQRTTANTFCNIYACDVCYFSHAYLPRVWWYSRSIRKLQSGQPVEVSYGETVHELNANALHDWLNEWGDDFRWSRITTHADDFQNLVNGNGSIGLICARNRDRARSGHITVVLPETDQLKATRQAGRVIYPLQSQAGGENIKYFSAQKGAWWTWERFDSFGMYLWG